MQGVSKHIDSHIDVSILEWFKSSPSIHILNHPSFTRPLINRTCPHNSCLPSSKTLPATRQRQITIIIIMPFCRWPPFGLCYYIPICQVSASILCGSHYHAGETITGSPSYRVSLWSDLWNNCLMVVKVIVLNLDWLSCLMRTWCDYMIISL